jgi:hypothetical protein
MKVVATILLAIACLLLSTRFVTARAIRIWSDQELFEKSDLVVTASPTATNDAQEHIGLPGFEQQRVVGIETTFTVSAVLKGDKTLKTFVLHHYRPAPGATIVPNAPGFIYFASSQKSALSPGKYLLFLLRAPDGRYAPVVGQIDPGLSVRQLEGVYESAVTETQTKLGLDIANVLKQCQTIHAGMIRADLSKVFTTEGGLSTVTWRTYIYRDCPFVKVDVEFAPSTPKQAVEKPTDTITKISKPYLEWSIAD